MMIEKLNEYLMVRKVFSSNDLKCCFNYHSGEYAYN